MYDRVFNTINWLKMNTIKKFVSHTNLYYAERTLILWALLGLSWIPDLWAFMTDGEFLNQHQTCEHN